MSDRRRSAAALAAFIAALGCLLTAIWITDGWMTSQRLLATAGVLGVAAVVAMVSTW